MLEDKAARNRLGLTGSPSAELAQAWTGGEVGVGLGVTHRPHPPLDAHLALEHRPVKTKRGPRIVAQIAGLGAFEIGVENETVFVDVLEQHHAHGRPALQIGGGERHGGGVALLAVAGVGKPFLEKRDGIWDGHRCGRKSTRRTDRDA